MTRQRNEQVTALAGKARQLFSAEVNKASTTKFIETDELGGFRRCFAEPQVLVQGLIAEEDRVVAVLYGSGVHAGFLLGYPPTGRRIGVRGLALLRLRGGVVHGCNALWDTVTLVRQLDIAAKGLPAEARPHPASMATGVEGRVARTAQLFTVARDRVAAMKFLDIGDPTSFRGTFHPSAVTVEQLTAENGRVVASVVGSGVHSAYALGQAPTGRSVSARGLVLISLSAGRVTGSEVLWDILDLQRQLAPDPQLTATREVRPAQSVAPTPTPTPPAVPLSTPSPAAEVDWSELSRRDAAKREAARYMNYQNSRFISDFRAKGW